MWSCALADVEEGLVQAVCDDGGEGYSRGRYTCDSIEAFGSQLGFCEVHVEVANSSKRVREAWDDSKVDVIGACSPASELESSKLQGANLVQNSAQLDFHYFLFFV